MEMRGTLLRSSADRVGPNLSDGFKSQFSGIMCISSGYTSVIVALIVCCGNPLIQIPSYKIKFIK